MLGFFRRKIGDKNYGFIEGEDQRDYFAYWNDFKKESIPFRNVRDTGVKGNEVPDRVSFDPEETSKGPHARNVFVLRTLESKSSTVTTTNAPVPVTGTSEAVN